MPGRLRGAYRDADVRHVVRSLLFVQRHLRGAAHRISGRGDGALDVKGIMPHLIFSQLRLKSLLSKRWWEWGE